MKKNSREIVLKNLQNSLKLLEIINLIGGGDPEITAIERDINTIVAKIKGTLEQQSRVIIVQRDQLATLREELAFLQGELDSLKGNNMELQQQIARAERLLADKSTTTENLSRVRRILNFIRRKIASIRVIRSSRRRSRPGEYNF